MYVRYVIAIVAVILSIASASADDSSEMKCVEGGNQPQLNFCAADAFKKADKEMNDLYKEQMTHLKATHKARLRESQRAWVVFRDKACLYEAGLQQESGSIWPLDQYMCLEQHTKQRIEDLNSYVACREDGCPE